MSRSAAIEIKGLTAGYGGAAVIEDIDLTVEPEDYVGIIGPNGGGKTTLLRVILGFVRPERGSVAIFGESPGSGRRHVGYVPQHASFDRQYPIAVHEAVRMGLRRKRGLLPWWRGADRTATMEALDAVSMADHAGEPLGELSGGQLQRVFIARALVARPRLLILDEPTASVDKQMQESVYDLLAQLNRDMTILLVTHDIGIISSHVKHVACLNHNLFSHGGNELTADMLEQAYQCPVDLIAHGVPHRVFEGHEHDPCVCQQPGRPKGGGG